MRYLRKKYPILGPDGNTNLQPMMLFNNSNFFADVIQIPKDITEVKFIRYYKDYSADRNGRGLIMVYTTGINGRNKDIGVAKIKKSLISGYHVVKDFHQVKYEGEVQVDYDDRQTLYWNPDLDLKAGEEKTISFFNSGINTSFTVRVKGVSRSGKTIDIVKHFQEAHENLE